MRVQRIGAASGLRFCAAALPLRCARFRKQRQLGGHDLKTKDALKLRHKFAQLAIKGEVEESEVALSPPICSLVRIDQTWLGRRGGLAPMSLLLFQGVRGQGFDCSLNAVRELRYRSI